MIIRLAFFVVMFFLAGCFGSGETVYKDGYSYHNSDTSSDKVRRETEKIYDKFTDKTTYRGPYLTNMGVGYTVLVDIKNGERKYRVSATTGLQNQWIRLSKAYVLGWKQPIELLPVDVDANCGSYTCYQNETVVFTLSDSQFKEGLENGLEISLQGIANKEFEIRKGYFEGIVAAVAG